MSAVMRTTSISELLSRMAGEWRSVRSIYGIPEETIRDADALARTSPGFDFFGTRVSLPVGPAAGPHSQIAPNIVASWLAGARVVELKTVQEMDRLEIEKPCIDALDEGRNTEWSTELSLDEARGEYRRAWLAIRVLEALRAPVDKPDPTAFVLSVGYTLAGVRGERVDGFIEKLRRPELDPEWERELEDAEREVSAPAFAFAFGAEAAARAVAAVKALRANPAERPVHSAALSTMHGCLPEEIEAIARHLVSVKKLPLAVKLNPTLLGYDRVRDILDRARWGKIVISREAFGKDLQFGRALELVASLGTAAREAGVGFGLKLSNTLAHENANTPLPGSEAYLSGRPLFPITTRLAAELAAALAAPPPFSFSAGVSARNAAACVQAGLGPLTTATELLKPGGYQRLTEIARAASGALASAPARPDAKALAALAEAALADPDYSGERKRGRASISKALPRFDCFVAPCVEACPANQDAPGYIRSGGAGRAAEAFDIVKDRNALPFITGVLCDHVCQTACSRVDYEGPVAIRASKLAVARAAARAGLDEPAREKVALRTTTRVGVIGAGPGGLACAEALASAGILPVVYDRDEAPGGAVANLIPGFRIAREDIERDVKRIAALGVEFRFGEEPAGIADLRARGIGPVVLAVGAEKARELPLAGSGVSVVDALSFLKLAALGKAPAPDPGAERRVVVAGGGNTAMDAARAALRLPGKPAVTIVYRRTAAEMPADREELEAAMAEGADFVELALPEAARPGALVVRRMKLGEADASGRRSPVASDETFELGCGLLVAAIGESPDRELLEAWGVKVGKDGRPEIAADTLAAGEDLYVVGDARRGPASIIAAVADGRRAAKAVIAALGALDPDYEHVRKTPERAKLAARGKLLEPLPETDPGFLAREAERCLACDEACMRCVEVCPNRANLALDLGPGLGWQIVHVHALCNECGNCETFCPWEGAPFSDKLNLFDSEAALMASDRAGFAPLPDRGGKHEFVVRCDSGKIRALGVLESAVSAGHGSAASAASARGPDDRLALAAARIFRDYAWLAPPAEGSAS